MFLINLSYWF